MKLSELVSVGEKIVKVHRTFKIVQPFTRIHSWGLACTYSDCLDITDNRRWATPITVRSSALNTYIWYAWIYMYGPFHGEWDNFLARFFFKISRFFSKKSLKKKTSNVINYSLFLNIFNNNSFPTGSKMLHNYMPAGVHDFRYTEKLLRFFFDRNGMYPGQMESYMASIQKWPSHHHVPFLFHLESPNTPHFLTNSDHRVSKIKTDGNDPPKSLLTSNPMMIALSRKHVFEQKIYFHG